LQNIANKGFRLKAPIRLFWRSRHRDIWPRSSVLCQLRGGRQPESTLLIMDDTAVLQRQDAVGPFEDAIVVGDHDRRGAPRLS
jgi:hypothetical protein